MAFTASLITSAEYDRMYSQEPGWEFWFGHARRKPVPTELHGILQLLLGALLKQMGYRASSETELRIVPDWHPRPDVSGILRGRPVERYPTKPIDVVFEVRSDDEDCEEKCRLYYGIGIPQVFYFDPERRVISEWNGRELVSVTDVLLANGEVLKGEDVWRQFDEDCL